MWADLLFAQVIKHIFSGNGSKMRAFLMVKLYAGIKCFVIRVAVSYPLQEKKRNYCKVSYLVKIQTDTNAGNGCECG